MGSEGRESNDWSLSFFSDIIEIFFCFYYFTFIHLSYHLSSVLILAN